MGTDFTSWSEKEIVAFLDRRGEDHDDCLDAFALVARAQECEHNTGVPRFLLTAHMSAGMCEECMQLPYAARASSSTESQLCC